MVSCLCHVPRETVLTDRYDKSSKSEYATHTRIFLKHGLNSKRLPLGDEEFNDVCRKALVIRSVVEAIVSLATMLLYLPGFRSSHVSPYRAEQKPDFKEEATNLLMASAASAWKPILDDLSLHRVLVLKSPAFTFPVHAPGYGSSPPGGVTNVVLQAHPATVNIFLVYQFCFQLREVLETAVTSQAYGALVPQSQKRFALSGDPPQTKNFSHTLSHRRESAGDYDGVGKLMRQRVLNLVSNEISVCVLQLGNGSPFPIFSTI